MLLLYPDKRRIEWEWGGCDDKIAEEDSYEQADGILSYLHSQGIKLPDGSNLIERVNE